MDEPHPLSAQQRLLLMAAAVHNPRPQTKLTANCGRVVWTALQWAGLLTPDVQTAWSNDFEYRPVVRDWQGALIGMIQQEPLAEALLEGAGMLGTPAEPEALPWFTACRLTRRGERLANELLEQYPEYHRGGPAEPGAAPDTAIGFGAHRSPDDGGAGELNVRQGSPVVSRGSTDGDDPAGPGE